MKINPDYITQRIGDETILIPIGDAGQQFNGIIRLNSTAAFIVEKLNNDYTRDSLIYALSTEYEGTEEQFGRSVDEVISSLREANAIIE